MEIKNCAHCGGEAMIWRRGRANNAFLVRCTICEVRTHDYEDKASAIDVWNGRFEQNPSEADKWLKEAEYQRTRADLLTMQRDQLTEALAEYDDALQQARRMLEYAGKLQ